MQYKIGVVADYDGYVGVIITSEGKYLFLDTDTIDEVKNDDIVKFRDEKNRAYFVKKIGPKSIYKS